MDKWKVTNSTTGETVTVSAPDEWNAIDNYLRDNFMPWIADTVDRSIFSAVPA